MIKLFLNLYVTCKRMASRQQLLEVKPNKSRLENVPNKKESHLVTEVI